MIFKNLPRGGKKPNIKTSNTLFSKLKNIKFKKSKTKLKVKEGICQRSSIILNSVQNLRYSSLHKGMIILGRLFKITDYYAIVTLPGQITGKLQATDISETYTNFLKNVTNKEINEFMTLSDLYKEGDYVICCVKDFHLKSKKVTLSLQPQLINQNLNPKFLEKNLKVIFSVSSIEDHGYVLETGLKNVRAFLSSNDLENEIKIYPGKQIICIIKDIKILENVFTVKVSVKSKHIDNMKTHILFIDHLIPGIQFLLTIKKIMKNGLQVHYGDKNIGYINQFYLQNTLSSYIEGQELVGTLLYITPIIKIAYFSTLSLELEKRVLKIGDITNAKVISYDNKGIHVQLKKDLRGFIPLKRTEVDFEKISSTFIIESFHKCKIVAYDLITKLYICTMEKKLLNGQHIHSDLQPGNITKVIITCISEKKGYIDVNAGKISGRVPSDQVSDPDSTYKPRVGQIVTARVLQSSTKIIFTLKKSLLESKLPVLSKLEDAKINSVYDGSIVKITDQGILVRFFSDIIGWMPSRFLNSQITLQNWNFVIGQTITTIIKDIDENRIILAPLSNKKILNIKYNIGDAVTGVVIDSSTAGVHLRITNENEDLMAFLPAGHMSPCYEVGKILASKKEIGNMLSAFILSINPHLILSSTFVPKISYKMNDLNPGDILLCSVAIILKESIKVLLPIIKYSKYGIIPINEAENFEYLHENQILFGKILKIDKTTQNIYLSTRLSKVWKSTLEYEVKMMTSVDILSCYLNKISELTKNVFYINKPISKIQIGERIKGTVESVMDCGLILKLEKEIKGIARIGNFVGNWKQGDEVKGSILWVNYPQEYVEVTLLENIVKNINVNQNELAKIPIGIQLRGEIILVTNWFTLVILKGKEVKGTLVSLPVRCHLNDTIPNLFPYQIGAKVRCYGILNKDEANLLLPICMLKSAFEIYKSEVTKPLNSLLKQRLKIIDENKNITLLKKLKKVNNQENIQKESNEKTNQVIMRKDVKKDFKTIKSSIKKDMYISEICNEKESNKRKRNKNRGISYNIESEKQNEIPKIENTNSLLDLTIADCGFQWNNLPNIQMSVESSSDSEKEAVEFIQKFKKKKLLASERREFEQHKEREIRKCEEYLVNCQIPQTIDQFDRLVLSSPDSSLIWIQYMAYHLQATEIDKARAVARRALKTICFREENEKLNVWQAWLNLELRFGSSESLTKLFQEAVKMNDAQKMYEHMLTIYTDAGRQSEVEKTVNTMITKFKQNPEIWINCGAAFLKIGLKNKSRQIMQRALQSLPENKHVDVMVRFAQLENKFGDIERSQTLFEQILSLYTKRIDVWSSYVDSLVKLGEIEVARKILDRAIIQALPARKMKILFKKYIQFEKKYGTSENVFRIQECAAKYVDHQYKKDN